MAQIFGIRYMATLFGIVFFNHQLGSFIGVWLGGWAFDNLGSYDPVWWAGVALGLMAAVVHLPINETPLIRSGGGARLATAGGPEFDSESERTSASGTASRLPELMITIGACLVIGSLLVYMTR